MGKFSTEAIRQIKENAQAKRDELQEKIDAHYQRMEAERQRQARIRAEIVEFNQQIGADRELQRALDINIRDHPARQRFTSCSGVVIAQNINEVAVFTAYGIKCLKLNRGWRHGGADWHMAEWDVPLPLEEADIGRMFSQVTFPEGEVGAQIIQNLLPVPK